MIGGVWSADVKLKAADLHKSDRIAFCLTSPSGFSTAKKFAHIEEPPVGENFLIPLWQPPYFINF
jgi:hypothetical protein